jgi:hypothetical protein
MSPNPVPFRKLRWGWPLALCLAAFTLTGLFPWSVSADGDAVFSFLEVGESAGPMGMGGAYTAMADDVHSLYWNPAGLGKLESQQLLFSYLSYVMDIKAGSFCYAGGGLGVGLTYLNYGPIPVDIGVDPAGTVFPTTTPYDLVLTVGYGGRLADWLWVGGSLKGMQESILGFTAQGVACDLGLQLEPHGLPMRWGISLKDLGQQTKAFRGERRRLPTRLTLGLAVPLFEEAVHISLDGEVASQRPGVGFALGAEYDWNGVLQARAGYRSAGEDLNTGSGQDAMNGLSLGLGARFWGCRLDYAFVPFNVLGAAHRVSLVLIWGTPTEAPPSAPAHAEVPARVPPPVPSGISLSPALAAKMKLTPTGSKPKAAPKAKSHKTKSKAKGQKTKSKPKKKSKTKKTKPEKKAPTE